MEQVRVQRRPSRSAADVADELRDEGFTVLRWGNAAHHHYSPHHHDYDSVIVCTAGSITFHVDGDDTELGPGDRIDLPTGVEHAATVGPDGVECVEGTR